MTGKEKNVIIALIRRKESQVLKFLSDRLENDDSLSNEEGRSRLRRSCG